MKTSLANLTKKERRRIDIIKFEIGCLNHPGTFAHAHHLLSGGKRISHAHTIPLCPECHVGRDSIHGRKKWFREKYGTDEELLAETDKRVDAFEASVV